MAGRMNGVTLYCGAIALVVALGGVAHFAALLGGAGWLEAMHAPPQLIAAYLAGDPTPYITTGLIGLALLIAAFYLSGAAGLTPRLPLTVPALIVLSLIFWARGLVLIPMMLFGYEWLITADAFGIGSSLLCVLMAMGFTLGLMSALKKRAK